VIVLCLAGSLPAAGQEAPAADVGAQVRELQGAIEALRAELAATRRQSDELRQEIHALRQQLAAAPPPSSGGVPGAPGTSAAEAAEEFDLLGAKVNDLEQTKVESGSKYHVRLSGLALLHAAMVDGEVDGADLPAVARPQPPGYDGGSLTAGARQSHVRFDVFGPRVAGARTSAHATLDFFGGFPINTEGLSSGFARLRTAAAALDWERARIVAGHETPFFSPGSPTSLVSSAYPAMWAAGNLWSWVPQVHVERRLSAGADGTLTLQGGLLDPLTGELPVSEYERIPTAGERSRQPAVASRVAWQHGEGDGARVIGGGGYYARQSWGFGRNVGAWAATADWTLPVASWLAVSGEVYRGRAISGLGASAGPSVVFAGDRDDPRAAVLPFESTGGWVQVQVTASPALQFNAAVGRDASRPDVASPTVIDAALVRRNTTGFVNGIYTLRSNLVFSIEYRRLYTDTFGGVTHKAGHLSVGAGVGF
jgi:hypothetical protein